MIIIYVAAVVTAAAVIGILAYLYRESKQIEQAQQETPDEPELEAAISREAAEQLEPLDDEPDTTEKE